MQTKTTLAVSASLIGRRCAKNFQEVRESRAATAKVAASSYGRMAD
jgi:hypothetical protein